MIRGTTMLIAHLGYPIAPVKAPMIYNPYFEQRRHRRRRRADGRASAPTTPRRCKAVFRLTNIRGALVTMPHKVTTVGLLDECTRRSRSRAPATRSCGAPTARCSATCSTARVSCAASSARASRSPARAASSSAPAASARRSRRRWRRPASARSRLYDTNAAGGDGARRPAAPALPELDVAPARSDPAGFDLVVNATPLGMNAGDPLPIDVARLAADDVRRRSRDEAGDHAAPARRARHAAAATRSAPTCCSSRSRCTSSSSASGK